MPAPNQAFLFGDDLFVAEGAGGALTVSDSLTDLLIRTRSNYAWPTSECASPSQQKIVDLESDVAVRMDNLDADGAHWVVQQVSLWGGNNDRAQRSISVFSPEQKARLKTLLGMLLKPVHLEEALDQLSEQPGLGLVMATKIGSEQESEGVS